METLSPIIRSSPVNRAHPLNRARVAWWLTMPGLAGGKYFHDLMSLNHGTLTNGPTWAPTTRPGGWGQITFDGSDDYVTYNAAAPALQPGSGDFTVCASLKTATNGYAPAAAGIVSKARAARSVNRYGILFDNSTGKLYGLWTDAIGDGVETPGTTGFNDATWHRATLVIARSAGTMTLYRDGGNASSVSIVANAGTTSTTDLFSIGAFTNSGNSGPSLHFSGAIDNVSISSRAWSAAEVFADYELSRRGYPDVLNRLSRRAYSVPATGGLLLLRRRRVMAA